MVVVFNREIAKISRLKLSIQNQKVVQKVINFIKIVDVPTLIISLDSITMFLQRVPKVEKENKEKFAILSERYIPIFRALSHKLFSFKNYLEFIFPFYKKLLEQQFLLLGEGRNRLIEIEKAVEGVVEHPIDRYLLNILDSHFYSKQVKTSDIDDFKNNVQLSIIEERMKVSMEKLKMEKEMSESDIEKIIKIKNGYFTDRFTFFFQNLQCLGCCKYFTTQPWSLYNQTTSFYQIENIQLKDFGEFSTIENKIKSSMCSFLNKSAGGIILIGCERVGTSVVANGMKLTEKQKESVQQKIENYFCRYEPKISRNKGVKIQFIPVYAYDKFALNPKHFNSLYVVRIVLEPSFPTKTYFHKVTSDTINIQARIKSTSVNLKSSEMYRFMHDKYREMKPLELKLKRMIPTYDDKIYPIFRHYGQPCEEAERGIFSTEEESYQNYEEVQEAKVNVVYKEKEPKQETKFKEKHQKDEKPKLKETKKIEKEEEEEEEKGTNETGENKGRLKFASLLVADDQSRIKYQEALDAEPGLKGSYEIVKDFAHENFKLVKNTWVIHHREKYEAMKKVIQRKGLKMKGGKAIHLISAMPYISVPLGLSEDWKDWLCKSILSAMGESEGILSFVYEYGKNGEYCEIYKMSSVRAAIYAYFLLDQNHIKVRFIRGSRHFRDLEDTGFEGYGSYAASSECSQPFPMNPQPLYPTFNGYSYQE